MDNKYQVLRKIGEGQHGAVYLVQKNIQKNTLAHKYTSSSEEELYAMKKIPIYKHSFDFQAKLLLALNHPNVVQVKQVYQDKEYLVIILQLAEEGDLHQYIKRNFHKNVPESYIMSWMSQLCLGLYYLHHENSIIHRDIKTRNILVKENGIIKLADFGVARKLEKGEDFAKTSVGTPYYLAPESINQGKYDNRSDVWGLGCVLYQICTGQKPFQGESLGVLLHNIVNNEFVEIPKKYSPELRQLITSMLKKDPKDRPSILSLLENSYLKRQFKRLKEKYSEYEKIVYPQECPKTTKYMDVDGSKMNSLRIFSQSLKTTKNQKCIRVQIEQKQSQSQQSTKKIKIQREKSFSTSQFILPPKPNRVIQNNKTSNIQRRTSNSTIQIKKSEYLDSQKNRLEKKSLCTFAESLGKITQGSVQLNRKVERQKFLDKSLKSIIANRAKQKQQKTVTNVNILLGRFE